MNQTEAIYGIKDFILSNEISKLEIQLAKLI